MKFALCVPDEFAIHYAQQPFEISGLLQWAKVLGGDVVRINEDLTPYDVIMTNISSTETEYLSIIRQENPEAKIIVCFDYGFDVVNQYFFSLERVKQIMNRADYVFSVNKNQVEWMRFLLPEKTVHYIPHPTDVTNMVRFRKNREDRNGGVGIMWHSYDNYNIQSLEVMKGVERKLKRRVRRTLIGLKPRQMAERGIRVASTTSPVISDDYPDEKLRGKPLDPDLPKVVQMAPDGQSWDAVLPYLGVEGWYSNLASFDVCLDLYTTNSIGRFGIDCAGVSVPCVASNKQDSSKLLWPFTTVDPYLPLPAVERISKLLSSNDVFYNRVLETSDRNLEKHFGFDISRRRMLKILEECDA